MAKLTVNVWYDEATDEVVITSAEPARVDLILNPKRGSSPDRKLRELLRAEGVDVPDAEG
ncbi:hypothetical protein [Frankia tisae]|uniref:hypothetical protein n=1 Tax=Frankia tisae TaxID=2950104 RepID=UPI0021C148AA|nr:hypothetical protein [Frankia tisae]